MSAPSSVQAEEIKSALVDFLVFLEAQPARVLTRLVKYTHGDVQLAFGPLAQALESGVFIQYLQTESEMHPSDDLEAHFRVFYDLFLLRDLLNKTPLQELLMLLSIVHSDNLAQRFSRIEGVHGVLTHLGPAAISDIHSALAEPAGR